jgi:dihydrodipicolinate synthase/N-acetylneuraminate lyase
MAASWSPTEYDRYYTALVAPFREGSYEIDESAFRELVRYYVDNDRFRDLPGGLIVNPEAGEVFYMNAAERRRAIEIVVSETPDNVPVFSGVFGVSRDELVSGAEDAIDAGVDGLFVMPPTGTMEVTSTLDAVNTPSIWVEHTETIASVSDMPVLVHPTATVDQEYGTGLPAESARAVMEEVPNVVGWKMTYNYPGYRKITALIESLDRHVGALGADASLFNAALADGQMDGSVTGAFNFALEPMLDHLEAWQNDDVEAARQVWNDQLAELLDYVYDFSRLHIRYKLATWLRGLTPHPFMRPPMPDPKPEEAERLHALLDSAGVETIGEEYRVQTMEDGASWRD